MLLHCSSESLADRLSFWIFFPGAPWTPRRPVDVNLIAQSPQNGPTNLGHRTPDWCRRLSGALLSLICIFGLLGVQLLPSLSLNDGGGSALSSDQHKITSPSISLAYDVLMGVRSAFDDPGFKGEEREPDDASSLFNAGLKGLKNDGNTGFAARPSLDFIIPNILRLATYATAPRAPPLL